MTGQGPLHDALVALVSDERVIPAPGAGSKILAASASCCLVGWRTYRNGCTSKNLYMLRCQCFDRSHR